MCIRNSLSLNFQMFQIKMLYQYVKDLTTRSHFKKCQITAEKTIITEEKLQRTYSHLTKLLLTSYNMNYLRKNPIYLKQVYTSLSSQIKFENLKSLLLSKRFIVCFSTTLNLRKLKIRYSTSLESSQFLCLQLKTFFTNAMSTMSDETLEKIKMSL